MDFSPGSILRTLYAAFNARQVDTVLQAMTDDVQWPDLLEDTVLVGKEAVRAYWQRQWTSLDPSVEPVHFSQNEKGDTVVNVHQVIRDLNGTVISDGFVRHIYTFRNGLIQRMVVQL